MDGLSGMVSKHGKSGCAMTGINEVDRSNEILMLVISQLTHASGLRCRYFKNHSDCIVTKGKEDDHV
jgi:hypothetical protein